MCVKTNFNVYISQRRHIQFDDEDYAVYMSFRWVKTTLSSLRTTTCDALIVPSGLHEFSLSKNYTVFDENHNLWRFDCTQWFTWVFVE